MRLFNLYLLLFGKSRIFDTSLWGVASALARYGGWASGGFGMRMRQPTPTNHCFVFSSYLLFIQIELRCDATCMGCCGCIELGKGLSELGLLVICFSFAPSDLFSVQLLSKEQRWLRRCSHPVSQISHRVPRKDLFIIKNNSSVASS